MQIFCTVVHTQRKIIWQDIPHNVSGYFCVVELYAIEFSFFQLSVCAKLLQPLSISLQPHGQ